MRKRSAWLLACVLVGCGKKEPPKLKTACVLSDGTGKVFQCFEYENTVPREQRVTNCNELEADKKTLVDGECPAEGRIGICTIGDRREACYGGLESCKSRCKSGSGTFSP